MSSPGGCKGQFYKCFSKEQDHWELHTVTAYECPHIDSTPGRLGGSADRQVGGISSADCLDDPGGVYGGERGEHCDSLGELDALSGEPPQKREG